MSVVIPFPAVPEPSEPSESTGASASKADTTAPTLRLVAGHEHVWELRSVEYDDALEVRRYECTGCEDVHFR